MNIFMSIMDVFVNMMDRFDDWMGRRVRINAFFGYFQQRAGLFITGMSIDEATAEAAKFSCVALIFALISMSILTYFGHFLETTMLAMVAADCLFNIYSFRQGVSWMAKHSYWSPSSNSDFRSFFMILSFCSMLYVVALLLSLFGKWESIETVGNSFQLLATVTMLASITVGRCIVARAAAIDEMLALMPPLDPDSRGAWDAPKNGLDHGGLDV